MSLIIPVSPKTPVNAFVENDLLENYIADVYSVLGDSTLNPEAFRLALRGQWILAEKGHLRKENLLTLIDYSLPSSEKRFFVIDLVKKRIVYKTLVAHGQNSGELYATQFSNKPQSHKSALGFYITGNPYVGGQGYSMLMNGIDTGYNENARSRSIVMHGATYVTNAFIEKNGRLGRSFGCPALPQELTVAIIDLIRDGSVVLSYYPDEGYLNGSRILSDVIRQTTETSYIPIKGFSASSSVLSFP
jgi:hypothetical protein